MSETAELILVVSACLGGLMLVGSIAYAWAVKGRTLFDFFS